MNKEHLFEDILTIAGIIGVYIAGWYFDNGLQLAAFLLVPLSCAIRNNRMMAYVEAHAFDGTGRH